MLNSVDDIIKVGEDLVLKRRIIAVQRKIASEPLSLPIRIMVWGESGPEPSELRPTDCPIWSDAIAVKDAAPAHYPALQDDLRRMANDARLSLIMGIRDGLYTFKHSNEDALSLPYEGATEMTADEMEAP